MIRSLVLPATGVWAALAVPARAQDADPAENLRSIEHRSTVLRERAGSAVVGVSVTTRGTSLSRLVFPGLALAPCSSAPEQVEGTGFFVTHDGHVVTTCAIVRDAARIEIRFGDGSVCDATLVGVDEPFRMAVLRTASSKEAASLQGPERVEAQESTFGWLLSAARPNAASHASSNVVGIQIVASLRPAPERGAAYDRYLLAPLSLTRGAAGGPLLAGDGRLLGMAVGSLVARDADAAAGSLPPRAALFVRGDDVARAARDIAAIGAVQRPMIGVMLDGASNRVESLLPSGPAESAGLAEGDTITAVGAVSVTCFADLTRALLRRRAGESVRVDFDRGGTAFTRLVTLAPLRVPPQPTTPPLPGAVLEVALDPSGEPVLTFQQVEGASGVGKAGVVAGDRLLTVDGRPAWRFVQRHRARPATTPPTRLEIERDGVKREVVLASK